VKFTGSQGRILRRNGVELFRITFIENLFTFVVVAASGVQRPGDARGDCLIVCPSAKFWYWAVAYGGRCYWIYTVCDVTMWSHILLYKPSPYSLLYSVSLQWT